MGAIPFIGTIQPIAGTYAPRGWALCAGQLLDISGNESLYSIIGTRFGGNGRTNFALPDLRGRAVVGAGVGPGLTPRPIAAFGGNETVPLSVSQIPSHEHTATSSYAFSLKAAPEKGTQTQPTDGSTLAAGYHQPTDSSIQWYLPSSSQLVPLDGVTAHSQTQLQDTGQSYGHQNMQPWLALNYIIALQGDYPPRS